MHCYGLFLDKLYLKDKDEKKYWIVVALVLQARGVLLTFACL